MVDEQPAKKRAPRKTAAKKAAAVDAAETVAPPRARRSRAPAPVDDGGSSAGQGSASREVAAEKARAPRKRAGKAVPVDERIAAGPAAGTTPPRPRPARTPRKRVTAPIASLPEQPSLPMPVPAPTGTKPPTPAAKAQAGGLVPEAAVERPTPESAVGAQATKAKAAAATTARAPAPASVPARTRRDDHRTSTPTRPMATRVPADSAAAMRRNARAMPAGNRSAHERLARWRVLADPYLRLCRLDRPIGFLLLLWPTWWGLWAAAEGFPPLLALVVFTLGVVLMRSAGCVINDYADRWLDPRVARTKNRPLAAGEVSPGRALLLFFALLLAAFGLVLLTNPLTIKLAVVGAFLAATYPFLKRYTHLPQIYLGVAFGWSIPMAFAAVQGTVPRLAWLLFLANILWTTAYDTLYAMVDREDDLKAGAKSTAILFGDIDLIAIGMMQGAFLLTMLFVGQRLALGWPYWLGLAIALALFAGQHWRARRRDREGCFRAFLDNNRVGMAVFAGLALALALR